MCAAAGAPKTEPPTQKSYEYVGPVSSLAVWLDERNDFAQISLHSASQQIAADLRNETYAHLQRLSLEFFGGRRTGDLIARIGSDTDRICNFLSGNLVDFASDVLMVIMTLT